MYLEHFQITDFPFTLTPNTQFYCDLPTHQAALNVLLFGIETGESFIKIVGEVGSGKTLLCRKLLNMLDRARYVTAYIPNPRLSARELCKVCAQELNIPLPSKTDLDIATLLDHIYHKLVELQSLQKQVILIIDEAQSLPDESLEMLRLLTNFETEHVKLLQIVLFGQPELDLRLNRYHLRQLNQRIAFAYRLKPLTYFDLKNYLEYRLGKVGYANTPLFEPRTYTLLLAASGGIPRVINILCHKAMLSAYGRGEKRITRNSVMQAIKDSEDIVKKSFWKISPWLIPIGLIALTVLIGLYYHHFNLSQSLLT